MHIPLSWLKEFVDITMPVEELAQRLTMAGLEVAAIETIGETWEGCSVGYVLQVEPHPNADRLTLCTVDTGSGKVRVVCGAPNVAQGQKIAFAHTGARLYDPQSGKLEALQAARIRGVVSEGMICSERELGLGQDHTGILVLPEDAPVGAPLADYLGDTVLDAEVTANRPDWLSVLGVAYEVAALTGNTVRLPDLGYPEAGPPIASQVSVEVLNPELCPRYTCSLVTGVKVGPSPRWMQDRLLRAGMRPINNVVDITNYVMLENGQPLHAFDFARLKGRKVVVRTARVGERLVTLDGVERTLARSMLVIADERDAIGLAGVMGGGNSEVSERTTDVLLESASFDPLATRRTAQNLRLRSEASQRFERGLRPELPPVALRRATQLLLQLAGGQAAQGILDVYLGRQEPPALTLTHARLQKVLGMAAPLPEVERALFSLGFSCQRLPPQSGKAPDTLRVTIPYWRSDITIEDDLVEEVVRIVGYEAVPLSTLSTPIPLSQPDPRLQPREQARDLLVASGMQEVITYSLVSLDLLKKAQVGQEAGTEQEKLLRVANPLTSENEYLRTSLVPSLLATLASNRRHEDGPIRLFEIAHVYLPRDGDLPQERETIAGVLSGPRSPLSWVGNDGEMDFYDAKGVVEEVLTRLNLSPRFEPAELSWSTPGKGAQILVGERKAGFVGEVHPVILDRFDIAPGPIAVLELDLESLLQAVVPIEGRRIQPLPRFPGAWRDLAVVLDQGVPAARVRELIQGHRLVAEVTLFDAYTGEQVPSGKRSLAYRVLFQSPQRTLTSQEVSQALEQIWQILRHEVGAIPRT